MVLRLSSTILAVFLLLTACRDDLKSKEKVQQAIVERLQSHSGLDLKDLDITTTDVQFDKTKAVATVAFHSKSDTSVNSGMTMKYNLEERDGKWVVTGVANAEGTPMSMHPMTPGSGGNPTLPPGHPSVAEPQKQ